MCLCLKGVHRTGPIRVPLSEEREKRVCCTRPFAKKHSFWNNVCPLQRICWVSICGAGTGDTKMDAPKNRNSAGTLLELSLLGFKAGLMKLAGTLLEPGEPLLERGGTLLELAGTSLLGPLAGTFCREAKWASISFFFALFLALPGCEVGVLA